MTQRLFWVQQTSRLTWNIFAGVGSLTQTGKQFRQISLGSIRVNKFSLLRRRRQRQRRYRRRQKATQTN